MKKLLILISILLLATGCSNILDNDNSKQNQIIEEVNEKFDYQDATCRIDDAKIRFSQMMRNDEILIVDEDDDFYYFDNNGLILAVDKKFVRTEKDEPFEEYTGYAYPGAELFADYELSDKIEDIYKNEEIEVIDKVGKVLLVYYEDTFGYMYPSDVSDTYIVTRVQQVVETPVVTPSSGGSSSGGGGGGGGGTNPTPPEPTPSEHDFGGFSYYDIKGYHLLSFTKDGNSTIYVPNTEYGKVKAKILLDGTINYITLFNYNEQVKVLDYDENEATVLIHGYVGKTEREYLRVESDAPYEAWHGYAYGGAEVFYDYELTDEMDWFYKNDDVYVIDEVGDVYIVELENGVYGYMSIDDVSETFIPTYKPAPAPEPVVTPSYSGGSGGGGTPTPPSPPSPPPSTPEETGSYM